MKMSKEISTTYILELNEQEAQILMALVQNSTDPDNEPEVVSNFREAVFNSLKKEGVGQ